MEELEAELSSMYGHKGPENVKIKKHLSKTEQIQSVVISIRLVKRDWDI